MSRLESFIKNLCGKFNNQAQIKKEESEGEIIHPKAKHINAVCNQKINNLPQNFMGYFVIEESYYETEKGKKILPHLFLFTLDKENNVVLTSYELPKGISKEEFRNDNGSLIMDYSTLVKSEKFNPMIYKEENGSFYGESISDFGNGTIFTLKERTEHGKLYVSEIFEKNGKVIFGFKDPIVYDKVFG